MSNQIYKGIGSTLQGFYKIAIVDGATEEVKWQQEEWKKNLILNQGMEQVASTAITELMRYGVVGGGSRENSIAGGSSTITQSGDTVFMLTRTGLTDFTSSDGIYATYAQTGDMLKYSDNSESRVTAVDAGGYMLTVTPSYTFTTGKTFTIWKTAQVGLQSEVGRAGLGITDTQYQTANNGCITTDVSNVRTHQRTYDFPVEVGSVTYNEIGVAWSTVGASTVFNRVKLDPGVVIDAGYRVRLIYQLQTTWNPSSASIKTAAVGGWVNTQGSESIQNFLTSTVNSSTGASTVSSAVLDPYFTQEGAVIASTWASPNAGALQVFGSATNRTTNAAATTVMSKAAYVPFSYYTDRTGTLTTAQINRSDIRSMGFGIGATPYDANNQAFCFLLQNTQSKDNSQTLSFVFRTSWNRTLA